MKKILISLIALLFVGGVAFADSSYTDENAVILGPGMGSIGITPPVELVKISTGSSDCAATTDDGPDVGDVLEWDFNKRYTDGAGLGYMVRKAKHGSSQTIMYGDNGRTSYAGVLVTAMSSDHLWATPRGSGREVGYMAIRGFVDAYIDIANGNDVAELGKALYVNGDVVNGSFACTNKTSLGLSQDIGILMEVKSADGLAKVWLR